VVDFRYHALSLVAVFMALGVGLLLGVAIGDSGLASSTRDALRDGLRGDVERVRTDARALAVELERRDRFERRVYPELVAGRLRGKRVGLVFLGGRDGSVGDRVRAAIEPAGGELAFVAEAHGNTEAQGRRVAGTIARGGAPDPELLSGVAGSLGGADALVVARGDPRTGDAFDGAVAEALHAAGAPIAGVAAGTTDQDDWYGSHEVAAVDRLDDPVGMTALVLVLAGDVRGAEALAGE